MPCNHMLTCSLQLRDSSPAQKNITISGPVRAMSPPGSIGLWWLADRVRSMSTQKKGIELRYNGDIRAYFYNDTGFFCGQKVLSTHWIPRSRCSSEVSAEPGTRWSSKHNFCDVALATSGSKHDRVQLSIANWPKILIQPTFPRVKLSGLQIINCHSSGTSGLKALKML